MIFLDRARSHPSVRIVAQTGLIVVLLALGYLVAQFDDKATEQAQTTQAVTAVFAASCNATTFEQLQAQGLLEECRLAQNGDLGSAIAEDAPEAQASPTADPLPDKADTTPEEVQQITAADLDSAVVEAVNTYFEQHPIGGDEDYVASIRKAVARYLTANPPKARPPTPGEIRQAVRDQLLANPPDAGPPGTPGEAGEDGVGVATAVLDGCDVVFTYTDGRTDRVGPLCGEDGQPGPPPSTADIAAAVSAYCEANGECRGPSGLVNVDDQCNPPAGEFITDVNTAYNADNRTLTITCTSGPPGLLP